MKVILFCLLPIAAAVSTTKQGNSADKPELRVDTRGKDEELTYSGGKYRCYQSNYFTEGVDEVEELDIVRHRGLGKTINYQPSKGTVPHAEVVKGTVPRAEVVDAILSAEKGEDSFEVLTSTGDKIYFQDLTRNDMVLSAESGDLHDLTKAFTASGKFVKDTPKIKYQVTCPAEGNTCQVDANKGEVHFPDADGVVDCFDQESDVFIVKANIPQKCADVVYDVRLAVIPTPHFFILGVKQDTDKNKGCPPSIMMNSISGQKKMVAVLMEDMEQLPMHPLGTALLGDMLEVEENAMAIDNSMFDVFTNSCVHYAGSIWRSLGLAEDELPDFLIENIVNDSNIARHVKKAGGARAFAAITIGGKGALRRYVAKVVHSELGTDSKKTGWLRKEGRRRVT